MAEFKISRFRYTWKGNWASATSYIRDDIIRYGGNSYVCVSQHTSQANFYNDLNFTPPGESIQTPRWIKMADGFAWRGNWTATFNYNQNDIVLQGGNLYLCVIGHTASTNFSTDIDNWISYYEGYNWRNIWTNSVRYSTGDVVNLGGKVYRCIEEHESSTFLSDDIEKWEVLYTNYRYVGNWNTGNTYRVNDIAKFGGSIWSCKEEHTSGSDSTLNFDAEEHWDLLIPGLQKSGSWSDSLDYQVGDMVIHGGYVFYSLTNNYNSTPSQSLYQTEDKENPELDWQILVKGFNIAGEWSSSTTYKTGDVVRRGGNLYVAILDTTVDGSTLDYLDSSNWLQLTESINYRGEWQSGEFYSLNDIALFKGNLYKANQPHEGSLENFPGDNGSGFFLWDTFLIGNETNGMSNVGDLLVYGLSRDEAGDGSSLGSTDVPIGSNTQFLAVENSTDLHYKSWGVTQRVFNVSPAGVDDENDPERGINPFKPFKTIRFAAERADDGFSGTTTIKVATGTYTEILPIIVPARTAILGDELRSVVIKPNSAIAELASDSTYTIAVLNRLSLIMANLLAGEAIVKSSGNTEEQVILKEDGFLQIPYDPPRYDVSGEELFELEPGEVPISVDADAVSDIRDLITDISSYINFYINSLGSAPTITGTNTAVTDQERINATLILSANKDFLGAEAVAFMQSTYSSYNFDPALCKRDVRRYIDAWIYDIVYTGNYKSVLAARYYRNAVLGSIFEDMFYLRDATGVRNCTLSGLSGTLNPPNVFDLYQRPTGGAYCSLDPGWGPNDNRTWITTRSPYIQGVTNIGDRCVGQKIDGSLHNGGNKSMVSNDFTQVISDGIGAWVTNNGRAELVSVFTYYATIGYFAENGGVIRATNGNNSYGNYGAIADGVDPNETPRTATVNNRNNVAQVASAFSGDFTDEILIFEWTNAGQNYTQASANIVGAGINAEVVFEDFRDNAVYTARLNDTGTTSVERVGGGGYTVARNNAQLHGTPGGDATGITISTTDSAEEAEYLGLRIIITSGVGTGQYGYITGYNTTTKAVTVSRESDDQPGWDHLISGHPLVNAFDSSTSYSIEPRVTFTSPDYSATEIDITDLETWSTVVYGETTLSFTDVIGQPGSGVVIEDDGLTALTATFDIKKIARTYYVTINSAGAGYAVNDEIIISGADLAGTSPDNDLVITVTGISDDSTNSITSITHTGKGASGEFVLLSIGQAGKRSIDGETWNDFTMPTSGNWTSIAAGRVSGGSFTPPNGQLVPKFVAIRNNSDVAAVSNNGYQWTSTTLPSSRLWNSVAHGNGIFVAVAGDLNAGAISTTGETWTATTLPTAGDSTINEWVDIAYGKNKFVALANSNNIVAVGEYDPDLGTMSWSSSIMDVIADSSQKDWTSISYGNNRFVAISSTGDVSYSFDGITWYAATMPSPDDSTSMYWRKIRYSQGVFFAVCDTGSRNIAADVTTGPTTYAATSPDGVLWTARTLATSSNWKDVAFGNPYISSQDSSVGLNTPMWIAISSNTDTINKVLTGATALGRAVVSAGIIDEIKIWDPGSGYLEEPIMTIYDPNNSSEAVTSNLIADGVLANPSWINRGLGYRTSTTTVTISGDGFAEIIPVGKFITLSDLEVYPGPGSQIIFSGNSERYTVVTITELGELDGSLSAYIRVSPEIKTRDRLEHGTSLTIQERYSQCRITGHDFLDIGTGNFTQTNYPELYTEGLYTARPENEIYEEDGGRVFYTSTDQSGNFRTGELFAVEQATGIVTISADFFDLAGLTELRLGGIRVGGTGVVIREFSTDPLFTEDSNNIIPTQKAIATYLANRLSLGGSEIATSSFIAGQIKVGPDTIESVPGLPIQFARRVEFDGANSGIRGSMLAQTMFFRSFGIDEV